MISVRQVIKVEKSIQRKTKVGKEMLHRNNTLDTVEKVVAIDSLC